MPKERIAHVDLRSSIFFKDRRDGFALVDLFAEREEEDAQEDGHVKLPEEVDAQVGPSTSPVSNSKVPWCRAN